MTQTSAWVARLSTSFLVICFGIASFAGEVSKSGPTAANRSAGLPLCVAEESDLKAIAEQQTANRKNDFKYDTYKKLLAASSEAELYARLAYAETKAANCPEHEKKILPLIVGAIGNRVDARKKRSLGTETVVYQRDQFSSSLNIYDESRYHEFLCPKDSAMWAQALSLAKANLEPGHRRPDMPSDVINYFLYRHSEKYTKEPWKLVEFPIKGASEIAPCIRFFHVPNWK